ncbi:hypothetical protein chiPu_0017980 [Chiloscyllium punctatum]|uniref:Uncharacterized protein n=1 Tax=Chiloscyllium punctatum TaxID=137246 RepID=A0A401RK67_CHIPU|nr:hypothetical protein [Chiloscyllium punctatum]
MSVGDPDSESALELDSGQGHSLPCLNLRDLDRDPGRQEVLRSGSGAMCTEGRERRQQGAVHRLVVLKGSSVSVCFLAPSLQRKAVVLEMLSSDI